jgi:hypothetical protein
MEMNTILGSDRALTLAELEALCDDPARDQPGGANVRAILTFVPEKGFFLSAQDGGRTHVVTDDAGKQIRFRTIEGAMSVVRNMAGLSEEIGLVQAKSWRLHD